MTDQALKQLVDRVLTAQATQGALCLRGGGTKDFYGEPLRGEPLHTRGLSGISLYEPSELVVTVRAGTLLTELEAALAEKGQYLAFEPPRFGPQGTVGGMVAAGLSGPSRASVGGLRDFVLGVSMLDGRGQVLSFGGQVIKNVAGYDVSRLMAGSLGTLGLLLEVSLKVLPVPVASATLRFNLDESAALEVLNLWAGQPLPINASAWFGGQLHVRLSGASAAVSAAARQLASSHGGERLEDVAATGFWTGLRDHSAFFFSLKEGEALWRLSVPSTVPALELPEDPIASAQGLIEWGGSQRWWKTSASAESVRRVVDRVGGHATLFRTTRGKEAVFMPLSDPVRRIHQALKKSFDPHGVFNPGRMIPGL